MVQLKKWWEFPFRVQLSNAPLYHYWDSDTISKISMYSVNTKGNYRNACLFSWKLHLILLWNRLFINIKLLNKTFYSLFLMHVKIWIILTFEKYNIFMTASKKFKMKEFYFNFLIWRPILILVKSRLICNSKK